MRLKLRLGTGMKSPLLLSTGLRKHDQVQEQEGRETEYQQYTKRRKGRVGEDHNFTMLNK